MGGPWKDLEKEGDIVKIGLLEYSSGRDYQNESDEGKGETTGEATSGV